MEEKNGSKRKHMEVNGSERNQKWKQVEVNGSDDITQLYILIFNTRDQILT